MRIDERIATRRGRLSPQERRAADTLLEHLDDLATYRAAELAELAGVSKATMSRLFRSLGYADFDEVRDHLRTLRGGGEPRQSEEPTSLAAHARAESSAVAAALATPALLDAAADAVVAGRSVLVVGWRNSYPVALHLRQQLAQARGSVHLAPAPGQVMGEELADLTADDTVVVLGFRRRPSGFSSFLSALARTGARVVLIGDPSAVDHVRLLDESAVWLECPTATDLAFDSYAAPMSLVAVLADRVLRALAAEGRDRVTGITATYQQLREVE